MDTASIYAIDLSHENSEFDWNKLNPSVKIILLKSTQGATFKDATFLLHLNNARKAGLYVGAYHFWMPQVSPQLQADLYFSRGFDFSNPKSLVPIIDVEQTASDGWVAANKKQAQANLREFVNLLKAGSKKDTVIIYTDRGFWKPTLGNPDFSDCLLWIAAYQNHPPAMFAGWKDYVLWQFSQRGSHIHSNDGGDIDWSVLNPNVDLQTLSNT